MFTIRKLESLPPSTRRRKIERLLYAAELELARGEPSGESADPAYLLALVELLVRDRGISAASRERIRSLGDSIGSVSRDDLHRAVSSVRNRLLLEMGAEPSEWDFTVPDGEGLDPARRRVFPITVYLEDIRSPYNVGSIFRTSECFGVAALTLSPDCPLPSHPRARRTARGTAEILPWSVAGLEALESRAGVFALELGGKPIQEFPFPLEGTVVLGSEELGVSPRALEIAGRSSGRVSVPLYGSKQSLNVSVAFGILMQAWTASIRARDQSASGPEREQSSSSAITP